MGTTKLIDDYIHLGHRRRLIKQLRDRGIQDEKALTAMGKVPRHWFVPETYQAYAYEDRALPIANSQTISQPFTVAYQTALLHTQPRQKVLEIGTGSGYQAAVLGALDLRVYTLERQELLYQSASRKLQRTRFGKIRCFLRDGYLGLPVYAPFDRILVTAGAQEIPQVLINQLTIGGLMVIPVGTTSQVMLRIEKTGPAAHEYTVEEFDKFKFVPFAPGVNVRSGGSEEQAA